MLLCGLEVRALLPGVAPGLAFDNSELTGAILPFFTCWLLHRTMVVLFPGVGGGGVGSAENKPSLDERLQLLFLGKSQKYNSTYRWNSRRDIWQDLFTPTKVLLRLNKSSGPASVLTEQFLLLRGSCEYLGVKWCCFGAELFQNFRRRENA